MPVQKLMHELSHPEPKIPSVPLDREALLKLLLDKLLEVVADNPDAFAQSTSANAEKKGPGDDRPSPNTRACELIHALKCIRLTCLLVKSVLQIAVMLYL